MVFDGSVVNCALTAARVVDAASAVFAVSVEPGEHHLCANVQSHFEPGQNLAFAHFTAEPGKVYYLRTRLSPYGGHLEIDQPDSDQAKYLISIYPASVSKPKK